MYRMRIFILAGREREREREGEREGGTDGWMEQREKQEKEVGGWICYGWMDPWMDMEIDD